jgi:hypothetical protein
MGQRIKKRKAVNRNDVRFQEKSVNVKRRQKMVDEYKTTGLDFGEALELLKRGLKVCREGWNGKGMWISLQVPDTNSKMSLPYIYMKTADDNLVPWLASQTDMLASDWMLVE